MRGLWACWLALVLGTAGAGQTQQTRAEVRTAVLQALIADPDLGQYPLAASVDAKGRVVLNGALPSKKDKDRATHIVKHIAGVHEVDNQIAINPAAPPLTGGAAAAPAAAAEPASAAGDADAQAAILNALANQPELRGITVAVSPRQIILGGHVRSQRAKNEAAAIARQNAAGRKLKNQIKVRHE